MASKDESWETVKLAPGLQRNSFATEVVCIYVYHGDSAT